MILGGLLFNIFRIYTLNDFLLEKKLTVYLG